MNELILRGKNIGWDEQISDNVYKDFTFGSLKEQDKIEGIGKGKKTYI